MDIILLLKSFILIIGIPALIIYFIRRKIKNDKRIKTATDNDLIKYPENKDITSAEHNRLFIEKIHKYGKLSQRMNIINIIVAIILSLLMSALGQSKGINQNQLEDTAYFTGLLIGMFISSAFFFGIFYLIYTPISKLYRNYQWFSDGRINSNDLKKQVKKSHTNLLALGIISIPLSLGILSLLLVPHYLLNKNIQKMISTI